MTIQGSQPRAEISMHCVAYILLNTKYFSKVYDARFGTNLFYVLFNGCTELYWEFLAIFGCKGFTFSEINC